MANKDVYISTHDQEKIRQKLFSASQYTWRQIWQFLMYVSVGVAKLKAMDDEVYTHLRITAWWMELENNTCSGCGDTGSHLTALGELSTNRYSGTANKIMMNNSRRLSIAWNDRLPNLEWFAAFETLLTGDADPKSFRARIRPSAVSHGYSSPR
jgi:hypothetical protein